MLFDELIITSSITGSFCNRKFDSVYSYQYKLLVEEYKKIKPRERKEYEEIGEKANRTATL